LGKEKYKRIDQTQEGIHRDHYTKVSDEAATGGPKRNKLLIPVACIDNVFINIVQQNECAC
jgi:hypothetical protein